MRAPLVTSFLLLFLSRFSSAWAGNADFVGIRPLGMGGALRGAATGDAAPLLNPSGVSLIRAYAVEAAYQHLRPGGTHVLHASIVDGTSDLNVGGALYYNFLTGSPGGQSVTSHEGGFSLSFPFGERVFLGGTVKYLLDKVTGTPAGDATSKGFTFDLGLTVRPLQPLTFAVVGYNLTETKTLRAPRSVGAGATLSPTAELLLAFDGLLDFTDTDPKRGNALSLMGGAEYLLAGKTALRAGGGRDGLRQGGYLSAGLSLVSEVGALDVGFRQDLSGVAKATFLGVSFRLFVPAH